MSIYLSIVFFLIYPILSVALFAMVAVDVVECIRQRKSRNEIKRNNLGRLWRWIKDNWKGYWKASCYHANSKIDRELRAQKKKKQEK